MVCCWLHSQGVTWHGLSFGTSQVDYNDMISLDLPESNSAESAETTCDGISQNLCGKLH